MPVISNNPTPPNVITTFTSPAPSPGPTSTTFTAPAPPADPSSTTFTAPAVARPTPPFWRINKLTPKFTQNVGQSQSTFTLSSQYFDWQAQFISYSVGLAPMSRDAAAPAIAALLKGRVTPFLFGPIGKERFAQGAANTLAAGTVTIQTAAAIGSATITLATPLLTQTVFKALDYLQVGNYLYVVLEDAVSNGAGVVTVKLFNRLRAATSVADVVTFSSPQGLFRVATNTTQWDVDTATTYGLGFDLVESF